MPVRGEERDVCRDESGVDHVLFSMHSTYRECLHSKFLRKKGGWGI